MFFIRPICLILKVSEQSGIFYASGTTGITIMDWKTGVTLYNKSTPVKEAANNESKAVMKACNTSIDKIVRRLESDRTEIEKILQDTRE